MGNSKSEILIIDDVPKNIQVISNILKKEGYEISFALNGEQGLKNVAFKAPDLILLDISMPGMDGFEFCKELKKEDKYNSIPIIFLTARTDMNDVVKGLEYGAVDYITKPFNAQELTSRISTHLELKHSRDIILEQNEKILQQNKELNELNATKDKFFSIIAHDLKNPFYILVGYSKILLDDFVNLPPNQIKSFLDIIYKTSQNGSELLENLLHWSRAQRGLIKCNPTKLKLTSSIQFTYDLLISFAKSKQLSMTIHAPDDLCAYADKQMVNTVIRNLLSNAIKFTPRNGRIDIYAQSSGEDFVEIKISDTGEGISANNMGKLFRLDKHLTTSGTENEKGTGLGLLLCKEFVEKNNGKIGVESEINKGSTFFFTLPKYKEIKEL